MGCSPKFVDCSTLRRAENHLESHGRQQVPLPDDGTRRRQGIPGPIRQCWPRCTGISGRKASVEGFLEGTFQENGFFGIWDHGRLGRGIGAYNWTTYFEESWEWVPVRSQMSMRLERSVWANHLWKLYHKCRRGLPYLQKPTMTSRWLEQSKVAPTATMDSEEQQDVGKRRRISAGMVTEDVERRVSQRKLACGPIGSFGLEFRSKTPGRGVLYLRECRRC